MWIKKLLLLLCAILVNSSDSLIESLEKTVSINFKNHDLWMDLSDQTDDFLYATCDSKRGNKLNYVCNVTLLVTPDFHQKTCRVNVKRWSGNDGNNQHRLQFLTSDTVLWTQYHTQNHQKLVGLTLYIIQMENCTIIELPVREIKRLALRDGVRNGHDFDLVYQSSDNIISTITFGVHGEVDSSPRELRRLPNFKKEEVWTPLFFTDFIRYGPIYYLRSLKGKPDHRIYNICNGAKYEIFRSNVTLSPVSTTNSKLSFCENFGNGKALCKQFDSEGELLKNHPMEFKNPKNVRLMTYNMVDGGLVVVKFEITGGNATSKFILIDNDVHYLPLFISHGKFNSLHEYKFSEDHDEICLKLVTKDKKGNQELIKYRVDCVTKYVY